MLKGFLDAAAFFIKGEAVQYTNTISETSNFTYGTARNRGLRSTRSDPHFLGAAKGLKAGPGYAFRVGIGSSWSPWYTFTTAGLKKTEDLSYVYCGVANLGGSG